MTRRIVGDEFFRAMARAFVARNKPKHGGDPALWRRVPRLCRGLRAGARPRLSAPMSRESRTPGWRPIIRRRMSRWTLAALAADRSAGRARSRSSRSIPPRGCSARTIRPHRSGPDIRAPASSRRRDDWRGEETLVTRPDADVLVRILAARRLFVRQALQRRRAARRSACERVEPTILIPAAHLVGLIEAGAISRLRFLRRNHDASVRTSPREAARRTSSRDSPKPRSESFRCR